jgi:hypothetical protein
MGRTGYLGGMHELLSQLWHTDLLTAQSIRLGGLATPARFKRRLRRGDGLHAAGMYAAAIAAGRDISRRFDLSLCRSIVDIDDGAGGLVAALCDAHPGLQGTLFERPRTALLAASVLRERPDGERRIN